MATALTDSSSPTPTFTASLSLQPPRRKIQIVPAIPRKLEKKLINSSVQTVNSRSATRTLAEQLPNAQINRTDESLQNELGSRLHDKEGLQTKEQSSGLKHTEANDIEAKTQQGLESTDGGTAAHLAEEESPATTDASTSSALDPLSPCFVPQPSNVTGYHLGVMNGSFNPDPETPPFVPQSSTTPTETLEATSSPVSEPRSSTPVSSPSAFPGRPTNTGVQPHDGSAEAVEPPSPKVPYPIHTMSPWIPMQTTPPQDSGYSPIQQLYPVYAQTVPCDLETTASPKYKVPPSGVDYGYGYPPQFPSYQQSSRSQPSASPVQSSYEGYTIGNSTHVFHPQTDSPSRQQHATAISTPGIYSKYNIVQHQSQYTPPIPQFGSHLPITPSATPSNSGSQRHGPPPIENAQHHMPMEAPIATPSYDQGRQCADLSSEFKEKCEETQRILQEVTDVSACPYPLARHLLDSFNDPAYADCELYIAHVSHRFEPAVVSLHSLLIVQNTKMRQLLQSAEIREDGKKQILLTVQDQYANPSAIKSTLKVCYGERPVSPTGYPGDLPSEPDISTAWMSNALALAAAGHLLDMVGVAHRGEQIASMILDWHNLERALGFAMDSSMRRVWGSSNGSSDFPNNASELLLSCLYFVIGNVSEKTSLNLKAEPLSVIDRLSTGSESQPHLIRSRLSRIQFGELPTKMKEPAEKHDSLASSILFSLSFAHLKFILDRVPIDVNHKIARPVVEERERRRLQALHAQIRNSATEDCNSALTQQERMVNGDDEEDGRPTVERS
ncbi:MAG: hypothetical protein Q9218_006008 [Villophora microphyllina]